MSAVNPYYKQLQIQTNCFTAIMSLTRVSVNIQNEILKRNEKLENNRF